MHHYVFVMEYAAGGELFERLCTVGSFSESTAALLTRDVASGLKHCHDNGVIHRDMKLENLLLPTPALADVKLADFGMAHRSRGITTTLCGTPGFLAPEQRFQLPSSRGADFPLMHRGRGVHADSPRRRGAATPRLPRG